VDEQRQIRINSDSLRKDDDRMLKTNVNIASAAQQILLGNTVRLIHHFNGECVACGLTLALEQLYNHCKPNHKE
jgi:hypothetical protein